MEFLLFMAFVISQRLLELVVARRNEKWARAQGAVEFGQNHYPYMIALHTTFLIAMIVEYYLLGGVFNPYMLGAFLFLISLKIYVLGTLGKYWNTKILRIPNSVFISNGLYKYVKHPNYAIVIAEIIVIPMVFGLCYTAVIFTLLNAVMLYVRISVEEKVWAS